MNVAKAAVLGAGTMGAAIAAHLANAGIPTLLLDIAPTELTAEEEKNGLSLDSPQVRNRIVNGLLEAAKRLKPAPFMLALPKIRACVPVITRDVMFRLLTVMPVA